MIGLGVVEHKRPSNQDKCYFNVVFKIQINAESSNTLSANGPLTTPCLIIVEFVTKRKVSNTDSVFF